jgi:hypothetical protein
MSGGIAQLVAIGAQDAHLVGQPEVSFFRSNYKRHTNFAQTVERQTIQGNPVANGMSTIRFERKGDMLGYVYISPRAGTSTASGAWWKSISKVELLIGGQVIDTQDAAFSQYVAPWALSQGSTKAGGLISSAETPSRGFYPLRFSFCENAQSAIPLVALQYHDVELRITWGETVVANPEVYTQFIHLDTDERTVLSSTPQNMLITQTTSIVASNSKVQELPLNHPVKFIAGTQVDSNGKIATLNCVSSGSIKLQINGTDVSDFKVAKPHFTQAPVYFHCPNSNVDDDADNKFLQPFCIDTAKIQPTGTLNFSRLDSARFIQDTNTFTGNMYAVGYNILRIENGMGGLMYSN